MAITAILDILRSDIWTGKSIFGTSLCQIGREYVQQRVSDRVMVVKVNFKMAAVAILDFVRNEF